MTRRCAGSIERVASRRSNTRFHGGPCNKEALRGNAGGASGSPDAPPAVCYEARPRRSDLPEDPQQRQGRRQAVAKMRCGREEQRRALRVKAQERARARTGVKSSSQTRQTGSKAQLRQRRNADRCRPLPAATGENPGDAHETTHGRRTEARDRRNAKTRTRQHAGVARDERSRSVRSGGSHGRQSDAAGAHAAGARGKQDARGKQLHRKRVETRPARTAPIATSPQHERSLRCFT